MVSLLSMKLVLMVIMAVCCTAQEKENGSFVDLLIIHINVTYKCYI